MKNTLTLKDKREICVLKQSKPTLTNKDFAVRENTSEYLAINPEDPNSHNKRLRKGKHSGLEDSIRSVRSSILLYKSLLSHQRSIDEYVNFDV
nr:13824_t:CDS:2 [Entrophospora candida]